MVNKALPSLTLKQRQNIVDEFSFVVCKLQRPFLVSDATSTRPKLCVIDVHGSLDSLTFILEGVMDMLILFFKVFANRVKSAGADHEST